MGTVIPTNAGMITDQYRSGLLDLVDQVRAAKGMRDSAISRAVFGPGDSKFIGKLREGQNFNIERGARLEQWLREQLAAPRLPLRARSEGATL
jgi:hypothetical protein